jgi:hypothetical protein
MGTSFALESAALLAASAKEWTGTAVMIGVSARFAEELGTTRDPYEEGEYRRAERETRAALGDPDFTAACQRGYGLSRDEAIAHAVEVIDALTDTNDRCG